MKGKQAFRSPLTGKSYQDTVFSKTQSNWNFSEDNLLLTLVVQAKSTFEKEETKTYFLFDLT